MSNHSLPARGTDPPFSHESVVSIITHEQNIICRSHRELSANEKEGKIHRMIMLSISIVDFVQNTEMVNELSTTNQDLFFVEEKKKIN